jgi:hypothetical protein
VDRPGTCLLARGPVMRACQDYPFRRSIGRDGLQACRLAGSPLLANLRAGSRTCPRSNGSGTRKGVQQPRTGPGSAPRLAAWLTREDAARSAWKGRRRWAQCRQGSEAGGGVPAPTCLRGSTWSRISRCCRRDRRRGSTSTPGSSPSPTRPASGSAGAGTPSAPYPARHPRSTSIA